MVRHVSERLAIMYLGRIVETGPTDQIFDRPAHPYTAMLLDAEPVPDPRRRRNTLHVTGEVPSLRARPTGCEFHTRCPLAMPICSAQAPGTTRFSQGREVRCHSPLSSQRRPA